MARGAAAAVLPLLLFSCIVGFATPVAAAGPTLSILSPTNDQVIGNGTPVGVLFAVSNFSLVPPGRVGQTVNASEGHVDVYVDGAYARLLARIEPLSLSLGSGPHTIRLQLVRNDGSPLAPDVSASVRVVVTHGPASGTPTIAIVWPKPGAETGHDVYFALAVTNFSLVDASGQPNAPNEGHVQLFLNGAFSQEPRADDLGFIVDLPDGDNTVTARLVNNDNTALSPDVSASVTFHIAGAPDPINSERLTGSVSLLLAAILIDLLVRRRKALARFADPTTRTP